MSNIFETGRFLKYMKWDLRNAYNYFGLSLIIIGACPLIAFVFAEFFGLVFSGNAVTFPDFAKFLVFFFAVAVSVMLLPAKAYGRVTEKRFGSDWIMVPSSPFEKTLSMILIMCVLMPLCLVICLSFWDISLSLVARPLYGSSMVSVISDRFDLGDAIPGKVIFNLSFLYVLSVCENALIFTLGAVCFKKSKVAKTFLICFLASSVLSSIISVIAINAPSVFSGLNLSISNFVELDEFISHFSLLFYSVSALFVFGLSFAIYCRVRTIKH